ncbi:MAG: hypothetical protein WBM17_03150 [Anaerolineales bacterium]
MKEQILALESTDDLHTVRDKIARAQAGRLVLMWSVLEQPLRRRLDLVLMRRWAAMAGSELAIVSTDADVRRLARQAGIPCHPNLTASALSGLSTRSIHPESKHPFRHAHPLPKMPPRPGRPRPIPPALRIGLFLAAILSIAAVFLLLIPSVRVYAKFPSRLVEAAGRLDPSLCSILNTRLALSERIVTSGRMLVPTAFATGKVRLTNITSRTLNLSAGLRVASESGIAFEILDGFVLAPGTSMASPARAVEPGPSANLAAGTITRVLGPLALSLKAENPDPMSGGDEAWRSTVTKSDWDALQSSLSEKIRGQAAGSLQTLAGSSRMIVEESLRVEFDPLDEPDLPVNTPADTVGLTLHAAASLRACPADRVRMRAAEFLGSRLRPGETLSAEDAQIRLAETAAGGIDLRASGTALEIPDWNAMTMALRMQSPAGASSILRDRFGVVDVTMLEMNPAWLPLLPLFPYQIEITAAG